MRTVINSLVLSDIIHGDIKPLNALVIEQDGTRIIKLADFGDSSICADDASLAYMPKSIPWDPPEHHYRGTPFLRAKESDIYSFGLSCLWILFDNYMHQSSIDTSESRRKFQSTSILPPTVAILATLRATRDIQDVAKETVHSFKSITAEQESNLDHFFSLTIVTESTARSTDYPALLKLLDSRRCTITQNVVHSTDYMVSSNVDHGIYSKDFDRRPIHQHWAPIEMQLSTRPPSLRIHPAFKVSGTTSLGPQELRLDQLAEYMLVLSYADIRFRAAIVQELLRRHRESKCTKCRDHIAFQLALSYATGYGIPRDLEASRRWLLISGKSREELNFQIEYSKIMIMPLLGNKRLREIQSQFFFAVDHAHEYRSTPGNNILDIKAALTVEIRDIGRVYGETHDMTVTFKRVLGESFRICSTAFLIFP